MILDHIWTRFLGVRLIREGDLYASIYGTDHTTINTCWQKHRPYQYQYVKSSSCVACTTEVYCAKRRHQSPERMTLSHIHCFIQGEVVGFHVLLDSLHPRSMRASTPGGLLQFSEGEAERIFLASVSSGIRAMWSDREKNWQYNCP